MKSLLFVCALLVLFVSVLSMAEEEREFKQFQKTYFKTYHSQEEYDHRFVIFKKNLKQAKEMDAKDPHASFGVTKFSDLSQEEFSSFYLMPKSSLKNTLRQQLSADDDRLPVWQSPSHIQALPTSYDWRSKGMVTPVYNQAQCGSCWAFSTTENIESMWAIAGHTLTTLSTQQIVSCDQVDAGCGGGDPPTAYQYVHGAGGLEYLKDYPYTSSAGVSGKCKFDKADLAVQISNWTYVITSPREEMQVQQWTYTNGPPSICVDASTWSNYKGGVISTKSLCGKALDHCVQITGWDVQSGMNVWVVRNSWGTDWGYSGYLYVGMGSEVCGIAQKVTSSVI